MHLTLARPVGVEGAGGPGTKGLSMFIVPKWHFDPETGELTGERNGAHVTDLSKATKTNTTYTVRWVEVPEAERGEPVEFAGTTETGQAVSSADFAGQVLVVNFWYAACGPCRAEAGELEDAYAAFEGDDVSFLGINTSDSAEAAAAFAKDYGVTYPSVITVDDRSVKLAFAERTPISATPTTLVLDTEGRVASRIIGQLPDASILEALVRDALGES